eukprot:285938-Pelagomonas_calceolata.AAC.2
MHLSGQFPARGAWNRESSHVARRQAQNCNAEVKSRGVHIQNLPFKKNLPFEAYRPVVPIRLSGIHNFSPMQSFL